MLYTVYVLYSDVHNKIYVGFSSNLLERFKSHNQLGTKGWTIKFRPWKVIYCEYFETKEEAIKREKVLKTAKLRSWIHSKIENEYKSTGFISA
jgi:putative endonuclease